MTDWRAAAADVAAIVAARHADPFAVMGPHATDAGLVVRAFVPDAASLWLLAEDGARPVRFRRRDAAGFFETCLAKRRLPVAYRLRAHNAGGTWVMRDPYAFGPVLGPLDEYLLVEGTHRRLYERLGAHPMRHACIAGQVADGVHFAVWAPDAARVSVVGDFNAWDGRRHPMRKRIKNKIADT